VQGGRLEVAVLAVAAVLLLGMSLGARWDAGRALAEEQARTENALAARGALAERARIAREMHDVVAHELSAIAVRAETAPYRVPSLPAEAERELAEMADTARRALTELQQLLGVLRADDQLADRAPQPGLRTLPDLVGAAEADGVRVTADVADVDLPVPLQLTVFRVVQQALVNAGQHAPGSAVQLTVRPLGGQLLVEVVNGPGTGPGSPGAGVGLLGMRERAELHGGSLTAGPTSDGGFAVRAALPLDGEPVDAAAAPAGSRPARRARRTT
jgi:signal transduction histidine kinase